MSKFVHLHTHSHYSLLEALPKIPELVGRCKNEGMSAMALTDNGALFGAIEFYQKMSDAGCKPILGLDAYLAPNGRHQKRARIDKQSWRLVLLAENLAGYKNLLKLSSIGYLEGFYYKPRIDDEILADHAEGLICLSGGFQSEIATLLRQGGEKEKAAEVARRYHALFGPEHFYLELVDRPELAEQQTVNSLLLDIGREEGIPVVVTKETYYLHSGDREAWRVLACVQGGRTLDEVERTAQVEFDASFDGTKGIEERFSDVPEAIENTSMIAKRCTLELDLGRWNFPEFPIPAGKTALDVLRERAYAELPARIGGELTLEMRTRLDYELEIVDMKGFCVYFLIVSDFIQHARRNGIVTTTRGSAAGSLVGYAIGISTIDPLHYKLPFERFLNPERPSAPDVDADFADNRRDEILAYVTEKYGEDKVAQICTFGKMLARGSVRDVGRALGFPYDFVDGIAKLVPMGAQGFPMTLERALDETPELRKRFDTEPDVRRILSMARQIEGCARHVSIHAAGTVISPTPLTDFTPLQRDTKEGKVITQYEMKSVEAAGLVKMDFLGIRNLSILGDAIKLVEKTKGVSIVIEDIPVDDQKTFDLLARGETMGVFQLSGEGMTKYLTDLKPERVEDIMAMVALYRPGPIESIPEYIRRKHDQNLVAFMDPRMETILDKSYGVIVYQDDVMLISIHLAGYSWLEADKLRKAMGKKIPEEMALQKEKLLHGFVEHGMDREKAQKIWKLIEPFAAYGFNKAHAASYGMVAYQTAYMKANYPAEYMTAFMTAESGDLEKIAAAVHECQRMGIEVLGPDINESLSMFTYINDATIRFGLVVIKNLGSEVVESIIRERKANGPFKDLADFAERVHHRAFNRKSLEALIKAGALDRFGERRSLLESIENILHYSKESQKAREAKQSSLFDVVPSLVAERLRLREVPSATNEEKLRWERELLGLFLTSHPWRGVADQFGEEIQPIARVQSGQPEVFVRVGGVLASISIITTKSGKPMAFAVLHDGAREMEVVFFPNTYAEVSDLLQTDRAYLISAKTQKRDGEEMKLIANSVICVDEERVESLAEMIRNGLWVSMRNGDRPEEEAPSIGPYNEGQEKALAGRECLTILLRGKPDHERIAALRAVLQSRPGPVPVVLKVESAGRWRKIETDYLVQPEEHLLEEVRAIVGTENMEVGQLA